METLTNSSLHYYYNKINPEELPDLEIQCEAGTNFTAHRALLACHSPLLRDVFLTDPISQEQEIILHVPDFSQEDVEALLEFLYGKVPEITRAEDLFRSLVMDRPIVELEVEVNSSPLNANMEANPGELFGNYQGPYMEAGDIESAEVLIDNNNFMVDEGKSGQEHLCPICDGVMPAGASLDEHMSTDHPVCGVCNVQFLRAQDLADHWPLHPQCGVCGESVLDWAGLEVHERGHGVFRDALNITANVDLGEAVSGDLGGNEQLIDGRRYSELFQEINPDLCIENVECGQNDVNANPHGSKYLCNFCSMAFTTIEDLHQHTAEDHQDLLGALDASSQGHQSPVNEVSGIENTDANSPLLCGICKAGFEDFRILSNHVSQHISLGKLESGLSFACKFCPPGAFNFDDIDDLMKHTKVYHQKEEDHSASCPQCSRMFKNLRALKMHIGSHSSIKAFQCGGCGGTYSSLTNLKMHHRTYCGANKTPSFARFQLPRPIKQPTNADINCRPQDPVRPDGEKKVDTSSERARRFTCCDCGVVFKSRDLIRLHVSKCPAVKSKMLLHEAQVHLQGIKESSSINLPNNPDKDTQQISESELFKTGNVDLSAPHEVSQEDILSSEENGLKTSPSSSYTFTKVLTGRRGRPKKMELSDPIICSDCGKSFKRKSSLHLHKCVPRSKPLKERNSENDNSSEDDYEPTASGRRNKPRGSKLSPSTPDVKVFKDEVKHDEDDREDQEQDQTLMSRAGSATTRSGRLIKRKRFFEPEPEVKKRLRRSTLIKGRSTEREGSRSTGPTSVTTACSVCAEDLGSYMELFRHAVTHLEPGVDKTLPVYEDGDTGWCPHCSEPVVVQFSEEHVLDKHPEMMIPGTGPSRVILPVLKDELSPHLSDEETRILASLKQCFVKLHRIDGPISKASH